MADRAWKRAERSVARLLGGERASRATQGIGGADVLADGLACEVKYRAAFPDWLKTAHKQAKAVGGSDRLGIVVLREKGKPGGMVLMDLASFAQWRDGGGPDA